MDPGHPITFGRFRLETLPGRLWWGDHMIPFAAAAPGGC
jgi:hypothetical protein